MTLTIWRKVWMTSTRSLDCSITRSMSLYAPGSSSRKASERLTSMPAHQAVEVVIVNESRALRRLILRPAP